MPQYDAHCLDKHYGAKHCPPSSSTRKRKPSAVDGKTPAKRRRVSGGDGTEVTAAPLEEPVKLSDNTMASEQEIQLSFSPRKGGGDIGEGAGTVRGGREAVVDDSSTEEDSSDDEDDVEDTRNLNINSIFISILRKRLNSLQITYLL